MRRVPQTEDGPETASSRQHPTEFEAFRQGVASSDAVRHDTARVLSLAGELARPITGLDEAAYQAKLLEFLTEYRAWLLRERKMFDRRESWAERHSILLHLMVSGSTLGEAMTILTRFAEPVWGASTRFDLADEGRTLALVLDEPQSDGVEGLMSALWLLSSTACQLEFLVGRRLEHLSGEVWNQQSIPNDVERFLFGWPLEYQAGRSAIRIPKTDAHRAVTASAALIPTFLKNYMRHTVNAERAHGMAQIVADVIWRTEWRDAARLRNAGCRQRTRDEHVDASSEAGERRLVIQNLKSSRE